jgi:hypothetical protein
VPVISIDAVAIVAEATQALVPSTDFVDNAK